MISLWFSELQWINYSCSASETALSSPFIENSMALGDMRAIKWKAPAPLNVYMEESHPPNRNTWTIMCVRNTIYFVMEMKTKFEAAAGCKRSSWNIKYLRFVTGFVWTLILCSISSRVILLMFFWTNTVTNIKSSYINKYVFDSYYIQIPNTYIFFQNVYWMSFQIYITQFHCK